MKPKPRYYSSCEFLPLWNFFKLNSGSRADLKYLLVLPDRMLYSGVEIVEEEAKTLEVLWAKVFDEYTGLERNFGALNFLEDKSRIVYFYNLYVYEQAMLKSLLYRTNVNHIRTLRNHGYKIYTTSQEKYWESLRNGLKKVENHLAYIKILRNKIKDLDQDSKKEGNPYDGIMAWIASNDIKVDENITVSRYIKIKEIILQRQKAKRSQEQKSRLHGG